MATRDGTARKENDIDVTAAEGALRTIQQAVWIADFHAAVLEKMRGDGEDFEGIPMCTAQWHCSETVRIQCGRIMNALQRLEDATHLSCSFAANDICDDEVEVAYHG